MKPPRRPYVSITLANGSGTGTIPGNCPVIGSSLIAPLGALDCVTRAIALANAIPGRKPRRRSCLGRDDQSAREMPARLIDEKSGVCPRRDPSGDFGEMEVH